MASTEKVGSTAGKHYVKTHIEKRALDEVKKDQATGLSQGTTRAARDRAQMSRAFKWQHVETVRMLR